ncbi:hypothetical protein IV500_18485 [Paeniglutamicibacter antarcticus]|uniref:Uncharacterized protein n=1 Tax=Arthrobacter terrae TaxID=2935737 RepID=A0A931G741_9MICC|nr:hypothetical protein [Arthrobacter terrae]MBG0741355.1 hypothetical protein [Arthrobacter terrae]
MRQTLAAREVWRVILWAAASVVIFLLVPRGQNRAMTLEPGFSSKQLVNITTRETYRRQISAGIRRIKTETTVWILKSQISAKRLCGRPGALPAAKGTQTNDMCPAISAYREAEGPQINLHSIARGPAGRLYFMTSIDPFLLNILTAAERNEKCPLVVLVVGSWIVKGQPVSTAQFRLLTQESAADTILKTAGIRERAKPDSKVKAAKTAMGYLGALNGPGEAGQESISLADAIVVNASTRRVPAMRVPLRAIDSWWVTEHTIESPRASGGAFGVGVSF